MNTSNIKSYAPKARNVFIAATSKMAAKYGITESAIAPMEIKGDLALIGDRPFPKSVASAREALVKTVEQQGFTQTIEKVAYSWFNRLCAIRYMELHDYLGHGRRVLSHQTEPTGYQILEECLDIDLVGLDVKKVRELKLDGTKDEQLYRELLLAQCHALHQAMPFLFESIDDETELLLPENLTKTDSFIHDLVTEIPEEDWQSVEIIGWLYQFYISEKKDEVIGKVVKSEDIPAATQLFTPNWIVKYMVQNSLGAQWLATYPDSPLKGQMEYYITPAEQTDEVNTQLKAITPDALNPEELTLIDPASGSGHILVEAYDLFKAIYLERGYRQRDIAKLILEMNLFGLDIDQRAAQLTGFALMMKGREDDRRLFERGVKLNVMAMVDSTSLDVDTLIHSIDLTQYGLQAEDITALKDLFENATTFGSLIQVPEGLAAKLPAMKQLSEANNQDLFVSEEFKNLRPLVQQAEVLKEQYDAVIANPPYMGGKGMTPQVKKYVQDGFPDAKSDLFACFIERSLSLISASGQVGMVAPYVWMFLSTYQSFREKIISETLLTSLVQLEYNAFEPACIPVAAFTFCRYHVPSFSGSYIKLSSFKGHKNQAPKTLEAISDPDCAWRYSASPDDFRKIPGSPISYWLGREVYELFRGEPEIATIGPAKTGMTTGDIDLYTKHWYELDISRICFGASGSARSSENHQKWFPYNKGGKFRKWYGNNLFVVNWADDGRELREFKGSTVRSPNFYFKANISWSEVTSSEFSSRINGPGFVFDTSGPALFVPVEYQYEVQAYLSTKLVNFLLSTLNPTLHYLSKNIENLPIANTVIGNQELRRLGEKAHELSKSDWDSYEFSWDFNINPFVTGKNVQLAGMLDKYTDDTKKNTFRLMQAEEEINLTCNELSGVTEQFESYVSIERVSLLSNPAYRYGIKNTEEERDVRFREDTIQELISYVIGCMMGRYSLDEPGLIYANSGNVDFDVTRYIKFPADDDGIVPLTDKEWFADDAANRLVEFISVAWGKSHLEENLVFLAENLSPKKGEDSHDTIRRYLCDKFYKDHMQTYKKRPIYWLFSSGKQKAFQCLVYLHRYNEGTLARMRTEYVIPLTAKLSTHVSKLENDVEASTSTAEIKKLEKETAQLHKQQAELSTFDEKLRHYADQRISLDLDDGVKVNYGKFGDLLAEVKAITGKKPEVVV